MRYNIPETVILTDEKLVHRMKRECSIRNSNCGGDCGKCLFDYSEITPDREKEFLKWEKRRNN